MPETDAQATKALHEAGAILLGKTTVGALAYGDLWYGGRTRNPWNTAEGSSGSSAGSAAAVAAGLAGFAIGTETLGSIVSPSTRCGTTGLRPTFGRVSRRGAMPLCWSLDKIGPICRAAECTAWVLQALSGADPEDAFQISAPFGVTAPDRRLTVGYFPADFEDEEALPMDREALAAARAAGHTLVELTRADLPYDALVHILYAEAAASFEELTASGRDDELAWQDADAWPNSFRKARFLSAIDHVQLDRLRRRVMQEMDAALRGVDLILGPSLAGPMLVITNFTGHPSLCQPIGFRPSATRAPVSLSSSNLHAEALGTETEVPHSICLYGKLFEEGTLVSFAKELERHFGAHLRRPPMAV
ncbi:MAG: hypothetical protein B7Z80_26390 [Rhodospirillales bacterium 20-64-7]|nr:MAG: hypothetical protein B7Z80_26390 [Rhodospirillales bacterium 20-64-7]